MKRWSILLVLLVAVAVIAAGCGGSDNAATGGDSGTGQQGGPVGQAEAAACAANRNMITSALRQYDAIEGSTPTSIQALVPDYLQSVPACPSGGRYTVKGNTVTCSVHGS
jgi:hypothetical protein